MTRRAERWRTTFGMFVAKEGVGGIARAMAAQGEPITRGAVYEWIAGRAEPRIRTARALVVVSRGRIRIEDVYRHREELGRCMTRDARRG